MLAVKMYTRFYGDKQALLCTVHTTFVLSFRFLYPRSAPRIWNLHRLIISVRYLDPSIDRVFTDCTPRTCVQVLEFTATVQTKQDLIAGQKDVNVKLCMWSVAAFGISLLLSKYQRK